MIVGIILLDQFTKGAVQSSFRLGETMPIIDGLFNFTYVRNPGAAWGFGANWEQQYPQFGMYFRLALFKIIPVLACFWLMYLIWLERNKSLLLCTAYSLILAGAVGNLIDRISLNYVVDFLDFYWGNKHFPAFNVADSSISIAAGLLIIDFFQSIKRGDEEDQTTKSENKSVENSEA